MLEHVPAWMGKLLTNVRAGHEQLSVMKVGAPEAAPMIPLSSPAFAAGARLPIRFTADGEGVSSGLPVTGPARPPGSCPYELWGQSLALWAVLPQMDPSGLYTGHPWEKLQFPEHLPRW